MSTRIAMQFGGDVINILINGNNLMFTDLGGVVTTIEGLRIVKSGVIKEFPDLENNEEWKKIAIERLKEHIKKFRTEHNKIIYVKDELTKYGYEPLFIQKAGWRPQKIK